MSKKAEKTTNVLTPEQEAMRLQVIDLELKARYWKAQYEIRNFTLESEKLQPEYDEFLKVSNEALRKAIEAARTNPENTPGLVIEEPGEVVDNG